MLKNRFVLDREQKINRLVNAIDRLPALPSIVNKALNLLDDPNSTTKDISKVISLDPILTARILRIANSAFYGFPRRIKTIKDAAIILGFDTIRALIVAASVHKLFSNELKGYKVERGELWRHSVGTAMCAQKLASFFNIDSDETFIAGLLHDIGKVVIDQLIDEEFNSIMKLVVEDNLSFIHAEELILGFNHAEIGAKVALKWNLPNYLVDAIKYHHEPLNSRKLKKIPTIIKISDSICLMFGFGIGGEELTLNQRKSLSKVLKISTTHLEKLMIDIGENVLNDDLMVLD